VVFHLKIRFQESACLEDHLSLWELNKAFKQVRQQVPVRLDMDNMDPWDLILNSDKELNKAFRKDSNLQLNQVSNNGLHGIKINPKVNPSNKMYPYCHPVNNNNRMVSRVNSKLRVNQVSNHFKHRVLSKFHSWEPSNNTSNSSNNSNNSNSSNNPNSRLRNSE